MRLDDVARQLRPASQANHRRLPQKRLEQGPTRPSAREVMKGGFGSQSHRANGRFVIQPEDPLAWSTNGSCGST